MKQARGGSNCALCIKNALPKSSTISNNFEMQNGKRKAKMKKQLKWPASKLKQLKWNLLDLYTFNLHS